MVLTGYVTTQSWICNDPHPEHDVRRPRRPDGAPNRDDVPFMGEYLEIEPPERFTWTFIVDIHGMRDL